MTFIPREAHARAKDFPIPILAPVINVYVFILIKVFFTKIILTRSAK
jgi:hypothetical protein